MIACFFLKCGVLWYTCVTLIKFVHTEHLVTTCTSACYPCLFALQQGKGTVQVHQGRRQPFRRRYKDAVCRWWVLNRRISLCSNSGWQDSVCSTGITHYPQLYTRLWASDSMKGSDFRMECRLHVVWELHALTVCCQLKLRLKSEDGTYPRHVPLESPQVPSHYASRNRWDNKMWCMNAHGEYAEEGGVPSTTVLS